ncbi:MAG: type II secretion system minor pseudopilin GspI [Legionella longbeachae]|nr:type II secretion system minor pseudopilin GspI [Legionella longbeachae]
MTRKGHTKNRKFRKKSIVHHHKSGFTLMEVLLALSVIAIALTALLKAISQNVENTRRIKEKTVSHWVAMQGVAMVQLNLLLINQSQETTQDTTMLNEHWYWRAKVSTTPQKNIQKITILVSTEKAGPFREELQAFRYIGSPNEL